VALVGCGAAVALSALGVIGEQATAGIFWGSIALGAIVLPFLLGHLLSDPFSWEVQSNWPSRPTDLSFEFSSRESARAFAEVNQTRVAD
jgi:hypothetical protein